MNICIIDDNEIDLFIGQKLLERSNRGFNIEVCQNPVIALEQILDEAIQADAILLDYHMSLLNAEAWLIQYTQQTDTAIPVFILTSSIHPRDKQKAEAFQVVHGFFSKPLQQHHIEQILYHLSNRESSSVFAKRLQSKSQNCQPHSY